MPVKTINIRFGKFIDFMRFIPVAAPMICGNEKKYIEECIDTNWISSGGRFIRKFEDGFASYCGRKYAIATSNGTTALHLALTALGISKGDEVIVSDFTFVSPVNAIIYTGATPVLVDVDKDYWNVDPMKIEQSITPQTKAIIVVHLYGYPCKMDEILALAQKYNLFVIEDCAEAHGAKFQGKRVGSFGDISCFSFYGNKIITSGEGGMCLTDKEVLAEKIKILLNHGMSWEKKYWHDVVGFNYRMTNLQAAIGLAQLEKIDFLLKNKNQISKKYNENLKDLGDLIIMPKKNNWTEPTCWMYSILINQDKAGVDRDELIKNLKEENIDSRPFFYPIHQMPPYQRYSASREFPAASYLSVRGINLPSGANLTSEEINYITTTIKKILKK